MPKPKPKKRGPTALKDKAELPKRASVNTRIQHALNNKKNNRTMMIYRAGMKLLWKVARKELREAGVEKYGTYDPKNAHGGKIWGWPYEMNLTNAKVKKIMFAAINSYKLTIDQLRTVRKSFAYAWQLFKHKTEDQEADDNWPCMRKVWKTIDDTKQKQKSYSTLPERVPTPDELKAAFTKPWTPDHPFSFSKFCQAVPAAYDTFIWGCRSNEDHKRIKDSRNHVVRPSEGYLSSEYVGGRCKSPQHARPWSRYVVCLCPGGAHNGPTSFFKDTLDKNGNPTIAADWCCTCPLACLEFMWSYDDAAGRCYSKANRGGKFGKQNESDIPTLAVDWLVAQGICTEEDRFCHNSGRKSLARWCSKYQIEYKDSFQIHQDLRKTWKIYQPDVPPSKFDDREQSKCADTCCVALRTLAMNWKLGPSKKPALSKSDRFMHAILKSMNPELAEKIRMGLDSDDDSDIPPKVEVDTVPSAVVPRKRKRAVVKPEPVDPEFEVRPPPPKKRKRKKINLADSDFVQQQVLMGVKPTYPKRKKRKSPKKRKT